jgi:hypothetical protein
MSHTSLDLAKDHLLDLSKTALDVVKDYGLGTQTARVAVAFDISGSMSRLYSNGTVQEVADRLLALGMKFDSNQAIDVFAFDNYAHTIGEVNEANFFKYVEKNIAPKVGGGTAYAPVMEAILAHYGYGGRTPEKKGFMGKLFGGSKPAESTPTLDDPVFVIFITDGDTFDQDKSEAIIKEASKYGVFWKFVGIGSENFAFLGKLDDMPGRVIDNADFKKINNITAVNETDLYKDLLDEFPEWIKQARSANMIK